MVIYIIFSYTKVIYDDIIGIFKKNIYNSPLNQRDVFYAVKVCPTRPVCMNRKGAFQPQNDGVGLSKYMYIIS